MKTTPLGIEMKNEYNSFIKYVSEKKIIATLSYLGALSEILLHILHKITLSMLQFMQVNGVRLKMQKKYF